MLCWKPSRKFFFEFAKVKFYFAKVSRKLGIIIIIPRDSCIQNFGRIPNSQPTKKSGASPQEWRNVENMAQFHKNGAMEILHGQGRRNHGQKRCNHWQKRRIPTPKSKIYLFPKERRMPEISAAIRWNTVLLDQHQNCDAARVSRYMYIYIYICFTYIIVNCKNMAVDLFCLSANGRSSQIKHCFAGLQLSTFVLLRRTQTVCKR